MEDTVIVGGNPRCVDKHVPSSSVEERMNCARRTSEEGSQEKRKLKYW